MTLTPTLVFGAFKSMIDSAKALKDMNDAHVRHAAVIELQEKIFAAQATQAALLEQISDLEKEVANFETWETDKQRYEMSTTKGGSVVYSLKAGVEPPEPAHDICTACYQHRKRSILQGVPHSAPKMQLRLPQMLVCHECKSEFSA
jgi:hypothetical protein